MLRSANYTKQFVVDTDANFEELGVILFQEHTGKLHQLAFARRCLRKLERNMGNYRSRKLELIALKWAVTKQLRNYFVGGKFKVLTNNPLAHLKTVKLPQAKHRWLGDLSKFNFVVKYSPRKENGNADWLSRRLQMSNEDEGEEVKEM